jgi:hypothetical protein
VVEGTDMMKDETIFVLRKRSEPDSVVDSSGVMESFSSRGQSSLVEIKIQKSESEFTLKTIHVSDAEDFTLKTIVSDSVLLQGNRHKFEITKSLIVDWKVDLEDLD